MALAELPRFIIVSQRRLEVARTFHNTSIIMLLRQNYDFDKHLT